LYVVVQGTNLTEPGHGAEVQEGETQGTCTCLDAVGRLDLEQQDCTQAPLGVDFWCANHGQCDAS
jgi:hypothetical protein